MVCSVFGCESPARSSLGYCGKHYQRWKKYGTTELPERFTAPGGVCTIDACDLPVRSARAAFCEMHYVRRRRNSSRGDAPKPTQCAYCSGPLDPRNGQLYCSDRCSWRGHREAPIFASCAHCGKDFERTTVTTYCSDECRVAGKDDVARWGRTKNSHHVRRAKRAGAEYENFSSKEIYDRDNWICHICKNPVDKTLRFPDQMCVALDHVVALSIGGTHTRDNVRCSHFKCNGDKAREETRSAAKVKRIVRKAEGTWRPKRKKIKSKPFQKPKEKRPWPKKNTH